MKLYKVTMGDRSTTDCATASSGMWYVIANSIPEALKKAEKGDDEKAISVEMLATDACGLKRWAPMNAIEELEKLAKEIDERDDSVYEWEPDQHAFAATLLAIATRLRTEERDGKRKAFCKGFRTFCPAGPETEAERRWP